MGKMSGIMASLSNRRLGNIKLCPLNLKGPAALPAAVLVLYQSFYFGKNPKKKRLDRKCTSSKIKDFPQTGLGRNIQAFILKHVAQSRIKSDFREKFYF